MEILRSQCASMFCAGAGALGPRLAGRLTAELVLRSPQYMSCVKYYEIDLRGGRHARFVCDGVCSGRAEVW